MLRDSIQAGNICVSKYSSSSPPNITLRCSFVIIDAYSRVNLYDEEDFSSSMNSDINAIMVDDIEDISHLATLIQDTILKCKNVMLCN